MEILLQHRETGLFAGEMSQWVDDTQGALKFRNAAEAVRFANAQRFAPRVRMVARYERNRHNILLPLLGHLPLQ